MTDLPVSPQSMTPAGWYPDHTGAPQLRWWNGSAWTDSVRTPIVEPVSTGSGAYAAPYSLNPAPAAVPPGTPVYNTFIWILALLPILGIVSLLTRNSSSLVASSTDPLALYRDPAYLASLGISFLIYGGSVILAYFDRRRLLRDGYDRPFHWAWTFLSGAVYLIGRSIIVRRRSGRGLAPLWVWSALTVFAVVVAVVTVAQMMTTLIGTSGFSA
ncbi:MAG: DUF2510 domain-containing protein [Actinomycetota bacterium]